MSEQEEFEFRARAEAEQAQQAKQQQAQQAPMQGQGPVEPGMLSQAGDFITQTAIPTAYQGAATAAGLAASHPWLTAGAAAMLPNSVLDKIPGGQKISAAKDFFRNMGSAAEAYAAKEARLQNRPGFGGTPKPGVGPVNPGATYNVPTNNVPQYGQNMAQAQNVAQNTAQQAARTQQGGMLQRGMDVASKMREFAAQRVLPAGAGVGAATYGAVAAPGAAMMYDAYKNYQQQTPEQRKQSSMEALSGQGFGQAGIY